MNYRSDKLMIDGHTDTHTYTHTHAGNDNTRRPKLEWNWRSRSIKPKINRDLNSAKMHFWSKLGNTDFNWWWLIARTNSHAQNGVNFDFKVLFDLEGQGQLRQKTMGLLTKVFYISGPNLVILAWTVDELSLGQAHDWRTHRHTHIHTHTRWQRQYPKAKTGLGNKLDLSQALMKILTFPWFLLNLVFPWLLDRHWFR